MDEQFVAHVEALRPRIDQLMTMPGIKRAQLPRQMPKAGVYLLSENGRDLYVGRSNDIRKRLGRHCRPGATHRMAAFAFRLAREATGNLRATYTKGIGTRAASVQEATFVTAFVAAKARIANMDIRFVEESDPVRQAILEIYVAIVLRTPYNDFDNH
jgi:hypothetical protein